MIREKIIGPFAQVVPLSGLQLRGPISDESLTLVKDAAMHVLDGKIMRIGSFSELTRNTKIHVEEVSEALTLLPGLIDAHTHICFTGSRARDYALRNSGSTYLEIAASGGGIWDTVQKTRGCDVDRLAALTAQRANRHLSEGVTTIEVKSGYGLNMVSELTMLKAIQLAKKLTPATLVSTCLAAHTLPKDFAGNTDNYLTWVLNELLPQIWDLKLSNRVDIFIEQSAFNVTQGEDYLRQAKLLGFDLTVHADQFTCGGSKTAVDVQARSADHLEASTAAAIRYLATSDTVATALPGASIGLGCAFAPARALLDAGSILAIASDWNPGSAPMGDLMMQASILATYEKLSNAEVLAGLTFRAAHALALEDVGRLSKGFAADMIAFPTDDFREVFYHQGKMKPVKVWKSGEALSNFTN